VTFLSTSATSVLILRLPITKSALEFYEYDSAPIMAEDGNSSTTETPSIVDAGSSSPSLPTLVIIVGDPLSERHKDAIVKRIAAGAVCESFGYLFPGMTNAQQFPWI